MKISEISLICTRHAREVACLVSEGYVEIVTSVLPDFVLHTTLVHSSNGNRFSVTTSRILTVWNKNGSPVKHKLY